MPHVPMLVFVGAKRDAMFFESDDSIGEDIVPRSVLCVTS